MQSWRQLLGEIIEDPRERQRMTEQLKLSAPTLTRWAEGFSAPRLNNLRLLLKAVPPQYQQLMQELLRLEFGGLLDQGNHTPGREESQPLEIPSSLYERVFHAYAQLVEPIMVESIIELALQHALVQLDPDRLGMEIAIAQCVTPAESSPVRSLRETVRYDTPAWGKGTQIKTMFLGDESLGGFAVREGHIVTIQSRREGEYRFPANWIEQEESAAACPIARFGKVAGCLICSSTQPDYFTPVLCSLLVAYSEMLTVAFEREQYYEIKNVSLRLMPSYYRQEPLLATYSQRFLRIIKEQRLHAAQAEQAAWREIEEELIQLSYYGE
jgi:hypothetical protein